MDDSTMLKNALAANRALQATLRDQLRRIDVEAVALQAEHTEALQRLFPVPEQPRRRDWRKRKVATPYFLGPDGESPSPNSTARKKQQIRDTVARTVPATCRWGPTEEAALRRAVKSATEKTCSIEGQPKSCDWSAVLKAWNDIGTHDMDTHTHARTHACTHPYTMPHGWRNRDGEGLKYLVPTRDVSRHSHFRPMAQTPNLRLHLDPTPIGYAGQDRAAVSNEVD